MMGAMTLTEFVLARIAEDEAAAREAMGSGSGQWASWNRSWDTSPTRDLAADGVRIAALPVSIDEHVCRHDPTRVLAECEAKRRIVEECRLCDLDDFKPGTETWGYRQALRADVQALASVYADHPDYLPEWKP